MDSEKLQIEILANGNQATNTLKNVSSGIKTLDKDAQKTGVSIGKNLTSGLARFTSALYMIRTAWNFVSQGVQIYAKTHKEFNDKLIESQDYMNGLKEQIGGVIAQGLAEHMDEINTAINDVSAAIANVGPTIAKGLGGLLTFFNWIWSGLRSLSTVLGFTFGMIPLELKLSIQQGRVLWDKFVIYLIEKLGEAMVKAVSLYEKAAGLLGFKTGDISKEFEAMLLNIKNSATRNMEDMEKSISNTRKEILNMTNEMDKIALGLDKNSTQYKVHLENVKKTTEDTEKLKNKLKEQTEEIDKNTKALNDRTESLDEMNDAAARTDAAFTRMEEIAIEWGQSIDEGFMRAAESANTWKDAWKEISSSIVTSTRRALAQMLKEQLMGDTKSLTSSITAGLGNAFKWLSGINPLAAVAITAGIAAGIWALIKANQKKHHTGFISNTPNDFGERSVIVQNRESILTPSQMKSLAGGNQSVNITLQAGDNTSRALMTMLREMIVEGSMKGSIPIKVN